MKNKFHSLRRSRRGFTLAEILISLGVLTIAIFGLMASLSGAVVGSQNSQGYSEASLLAKEIVETIKMNRVLFRGVTEMDGADLPMVQMHSGGPVPVNRPLDGDGGSIYIHGADPGVVLGANDSTINYDKYLRDIEVRRLSQAAGNREFNLVEVTVTVSWSGQSIVVEGGAPGADNAGNLGTRELSLSFIGRRI